MTARRALVTVALVLTAAGTGAPAYAGRVPVESPGSGIRPLPLARPSGSPAPPDACLLQVATRPLPAPPHAVGPLPTPPYTGGPLVACRPPVGPAEGRIVPVRPAPGSPGLEARR